MPKSYVSTSCPDCHCRSSKVTHTYHDKTAEPVPKITTRRRRVCACCGLPFTTWEVTAAYLDFNQAEVMEAESAHAETSDVDVEDHAEDTDGQ